MREPRSRSPAGGCDLEHRRTTCRTPTHQPAKELPGFPPGGLTARRDRATADHALAVVNDKGTVIDQYLVDAGGAGLRKLVGRLRRSGVADVAIERGEGQVVDALLAAGLTVVVTSPNR